MATFPSITPTYGAQKTSRPRTRTVQFGDGYQQRLLYGIPSHMNPKEWDLTWNVSETDSDTIETFLNARAEDSASFDWTPLDEATSASDLVLSMAAISMSVTPVAMVCPSCP